MPALTLTLCGMRAIARLLLEQSGIEGTRLVLASGLLALGVRLKRNRQAN